MTNFADNILGGFGVNIGRFWGNDATKVDETDPARWMEGVLDPKNLEFGEKPLRTGQKPLWIQCN